MLALCNLDEQGTHSVTILELFNGTCYPGEPSRPSSGRTTSSTRETSPLIFCATLTGPGGAFLYLCPGSRTFLCYPEDVKGMLAKTIWFQSRSQMVQLQHLLSWVPTACKCWMAWQSFFALPHLLGTWEFGDVGWHCFCVRGWPITCRWSWGPGCSTCAEGSSRHSVVIVVTKHTI